MNEFAESVAAWDGFYEAVCGASATLLGLLFVSLALNPAVMRDDSPNGMRVWAGQTFHNFLTVLAIGLVVLIPDQTTWGLGIPLSIIGGQGVLRVSHDIRIAGTDPDPSWRGYQAVIRFAFPMLAYAFCLVGGVLSFRADDDALTWLIPAIFLLVISAAGSCWDLLKAIGNQDQPA